MKYLSILVLSLFFFSSCIEPSEPENINTGMGPFKIVGRYASKGNAQDVVVNGSYAYIAQGEGGLAVVDISQPENPKEVSVRYQGIRGYCSKIAYFNNTVYLSAGSFGLTPVDVTNPNYPAIEITNLELKPSRGMIVYKNFLLVAISEQGVKMANIDAPFHPDPRGTIAILPGYARSLYVTKDSIMIVACGEMGLAFVNVSNLNSGFESFQLLGWLDTPGYAEDVTAPDGRKIALAACGTAGLQAIDFSDMSKLKIVGSYDPGGYAKEIEYSENNVYMTTEKNGLKVFNLTNPAEPKLIGSVSTTYAMGLCVSGDYIYIADDAEGLLVVKKE